MSNKKPKILKDVSIHDTLRDALVDAEILVSTKKETALDANKELHDAELAYLDADKNLKRFECDNKHHLIFDKLDEGVDD